LRAELERRGVEVVVSSAGLLDAGYPVTDETRAVAHALGLDLGSHESRALDRALVRDTDLVIGVERRHVREAVVLDPSAWPRTFTLKELVRRGETVGPRSDNEGIRAWLGRLHEGRQRSALLGASLEDDIADPSGNTFAEHDATARELADLVERFVRMAWPPTRS
jgi:protein-tyrosine phosphatase